MKIYHLGIVGAGRWAENYCKTIAAMPNIELVAMARRKNERPGFIPDTCKLYTDWQDFHREKENLDGIIVASIFTGTIAIDYLYYDIPVLAEKPLLIDNDQIESLTSRSKNKKLLVDYIHLFSPAFQKLKEIVDNKKILRIVSSGYGPSKTKEEFSSLWDYGPHDLSMILSLIDKDPDSICITNHIETKSGQTYCIDLDFGQIKTSSFVGNGAVNKSRYFSVWYEDNGKISNIVYDDLSSCKLFIGDTKIDFDYSKQPLTIAIENFLKMIDSKSIDTFYVDLTIKITKILSTYEEQ
jgi:predicted dehydrogenase